MFPEFTTVSAFLVWLASGVAPLVMAGFFVSYVLERFTFWKNLASNLKAALVVAFAVGLSYGATALLSVPIVANNEELNRLISLVIFYWSNQYAYKNYFKTTA